MTIVIQPPSVNKRPKSTTGQPMSSSALGPVCALPNGWLSVKDLFLIEGDQEPLSLHADWSGPLKIVAGQGCHLLRGELYLGPAEAADEWVEETPADADGAWRSQVIDAAFGRQPGTTTDTWEPPAAETLAQWLADVGYLASVDEQVNLRLTLKSRGCDGQIRITRQPGRLRLTLELGRWSSLPPVVEEAVLRLARRTNASVRLVRLAWFAEGSQRRCEAQVDLSGLPLSEETPRQEAFGREMLRLAVASLELALARLGLELEVVADPNHLALAERIVERPE
ncbi:MAG: YbjN domain-containing protein [Pirellulales bacterium]